MPQTSGSLLLGLDGVVVESVHVDVDRTRTIHVLTALDWVGVRCKRKSFTESTPSVPPRARMTLRAKREMALAILDDDRSVKAVGAAYRCTWNTCHDAVIATADPVLAAEPQDVSVLGIDETRRGKANGRPVLRPNSANKWRAG
jgi:transposase